MNINNLMLAMKIANDPNEAVKLVTDDPRFQEFVQKNQGKTPAEVAEAYGLDPTLVNKLIGSARRQ